MAKLKIMHIIGAASPGGAETFALRLLTALNRHPDVELLVAVRRGWLATRLRAVGVRVVEAPFGGMLDTLMSKLGGGTARRLSRIAGNFQPHLIQSWMNRATRFMPRGNWVRVARLGGFYNLKYYFNKVDYLIGNTKDICDYCVQGGWNSLNVSHLANFVPLPPKGWQKAGEGLRARLDIPAKSYVMVAVGRLHPVKGLEAAIATLPALPDAILILVGEGPQREELIQLAQKMKVLDRLRFTGWADDIAPYAAIADVWLSPSRHEPLGNTVLDAWAYGVPVIASATGGLKMLIESGKNGLLVPVNDSKALTAAIRSLRASKTLPAKLAKEGQARLKKDYSEDVVVKRYVAYYRARIKEQNPA
jgi:glycosyltransferase involved in cell wall biosynthesis